MATLTTERCPACNKTGELEVTQKQLDDINAGEPISEVLADRDKLIQDQAEFGIHPRCFLDKLEQYNGNTSLYAGMGEL